MAEDGVQYMVLWIGGGYVAEGYRRKMHDSSGAAEETIKSFSQAERETCLVFKGNQVGFQYDTYVEILE